MKGVKCLYLVYLFAMLEFHNMIVFSFRNVTRFLLYSVSMMVIDICKRPSIWGQYYIIYSFLYYITTLPFEWQELAFDIKFRSLQSYISYLIFHAHFLETPTPSFGNKWVM